MPRIPNIFKTVKSIIVLNIGINICAALLFLYVIVYVDNALFKLWLLCSVWDVLNIILSFIFKFKFMTKSNIRVLRSTVTVHFILFIVLFGGMLLLLACSFLCNFHHAIEDIANVVFLLELFGMAVGFISPFVMLIPASKKTVNLPPAVFS